VVALLGHENMFPYLETSRRVQTAGGDRRRQIAICELGKLNDHLLADIGLRRDQLPTYLIEESTEGHREPSRRLAPRAELVGCG